MSPSGWRCQKNRKSANNHHPFFTNTLLTLSFKMAIILITGCSTGIGFATAEVLARSGHTVFATMRNPQRSPELAQLAERDKLPIAILPMDVDSDESVTETVAQILDLAGQIDVLVNNAGVSSSGAVEELPMDLFRKDMETNYFGTLRCIQAVLPAMRERRSGCIISVSSIAGEFYSYFLGAYCASKAAVEALSECLAQEVQPYGIRIALVQPGVIETPIFSKPTPIRANTSYPAIQRLAAFLPLRWKPKSSRWSWAKWCEQSSMVKVCSSATPPGRMPPRC
jgi:NAD(P)-dependent dehydrogenase (short-subunit alcohol dehydrogenase family)